MAYATTTGLFYYATSCLKRPRYILLSTSDVKFKTTKSDSFNFFNALEKAPITKSSQFLLSSKYNWTRPMQHQYGNQAEFSIPKTNTIKI